MSRSTVDGIPEDQPLAFVAKDTSPNWGGMTVGAVDKVKALQSNAVSANAGALVPDADEQGLMSRAFVPHITDGNLPERALSPEADISL
jgi:hypothetical protein